LIPLMNFLFA